jgi:saccharopine dehydrogenase-like NADP-dependent oxidoreductase
MEPKRVLVLGAGMVSHPVITYFETKTPHSVVVADRLEANVRSLAEGRSCVEGICLDMQELERVDKEIEQADLVISLLPYTLHPKVAEMCLLHGRSLITASYVGEDMKRLDRKARDKGLLLLNEVGLDPGIDHMEAMRIIHHIKEEGGKILSFTSYCGGLPAPEANDNPLGYKFSWSPEGVLLAGLNSARFLEEGREVIVTPEDLFREPRKISVSDVGELDGYPNRDSVPYVDLYGIPETRTMLRGTLRYAGWCPFLQAARQLGYLDQTDFSAPAASYADFLRDRLGVSEEGNLRDTLARRLGLPADDPLPKVFEWLGLLDDDALPTAAGSGLDVLATRMQERLQYAPGERDMIVLKHRFVVAFPDDRRREILSTLVDYGIPGGDSSMARTVGLPLAISARLVLEKRIKAVGVHIPIQEEFYRPVLEELQTLEIFFRETRRILE